MAESVDALVSNTSGVKLVPVRDRLWVLRMSCKSLIYKTFSFYRVLKGANFEHYFSIKFKHHSIELPVFCLLGFYRQLQERMHQ